MELHAKLESHRWILSWAKCSRDEWFSNLEFVRDLPGRKYDRDAKVWSVRDSDEMRERLSEYGFVGDGLETRMHPESQEPKVIPPPPWKDLPIPMEFPELRPYQVDYLRFMEYNKLRGGNGDEMGTGKTVQACALLTLHSELKPVVIVVNATTKIQWRREIRRWVSQKARVYILQGKTPQRLTDLEGIYIINWDILSNWMPALTMLEPKTVIGDEIQAIGGHASARSIAFRKLAQMETVTCVTVLSGTPIRTRPDQYWPVLDALAPGLFPSYDKFLKRYFPYQFVKGELIRKAKRQEELHELTAHLWIRRLKADVLPDLPEKTYCPVEMECSATSSYDDALQKILQLQGLSFEEMRMRLQGLTLSAFAVKRQAVFDWIKEFLESDQKLLVFAWHRAVLDALSQALGPVCVRVDGSTSQDGRQKAIRDFQHDPKKRVFLGNIQAAGVGLDGLQDVCSNVAFVEFSWSPTDMAQAEDRLHRIGQANPCNVYYLVAPGTIDEAFMQCLFQRRGDLSRIIDGNRSGSEDLKAVLSLLRKKS